METEETGKQSRRKTVIKVAVIFVVSFVISLGVWLGVKRYYGLAITTAASHAAASVKDLSITGIKRTGDIVSVGFIPNNPGRRRILQTTLDIPISNYSFNAPLTFAIMAAFFPFLRRKWIYAEALLILVLVHFLFVFSLEGEKLTAALVVQGYEKQNNASQIFWEFLWGFIDNMVIRFEPFLIGAYLFFFRNRVPKKKRKKSETGKKRKSRSKRK